MRTGIQFYTLREWDADIYEKIEAVGESSFDGAELSPGDEDPEDVRDALDRASLELVSTGLPGDPLDDPASVEETLHTLGADYVMHGWEPPERFESREETEALAAELSEVAEALEGMGVRLLYHNHNHEFVDNGGETAYDVLREEASDALGFELDLGWAAVAGVDAPALLEDLGERCPIAHLKDLHDGGEPFYDVREANYAEIGDGVLDLERCVEAAGNAGCEWVVYEHDEPENPEASLHHASEVFGDLV